MVRVVGKEGALGAGGGGNWRSGMKSTKTKMRRYPGRGSVCYEAFYLKMQTVIFLARFFHSSFFNGQTHNVALCQWLH